MDTWDALIVPDLLSEYGIDIDDHDLMTQRSWPWLLKLIWGLTAADTRLTRWAMAQ